MVGYFLYILSILCRQKQIDSKQSKKKQGFIVNLQC